MVNLCCDRDGAAYGGYERTDHKSEYSDGPTCRCMQWNSESLATPIHWRNLEATGNENLVSGPLNPKAIMVAPEMGKLTQFDSRMLA